MANILTESDIDMLLASDNNSAQYIPEGVDKKACRKLILKRANLLKKVAEVEAEMSEMEQCAFENSEFGKAYAEALASIKKSYEKFDMDSYFDKLDKELEQDL